MGDRIYVGSWDKKGLDALLEMTDEQLREMGRKLKQVLIENGVMSLDEDDNIIWHGVKKDEEE